MKLGKKRDENGDREREIFLEGARHEIEEVVHKGEERSNRRNKATDGAKRGDTRNSRITTAEKNTSGGRGGKLRVTYTNIDGLLSSVLEVRDYLKESKPDVFCIAETKLKEEIQVNFADEGYKCWRRDRIGKGGGDMDVEDVQYGEDKAEVIGLTIRTSGREKRKIILTYVPPKTNTWKLEEHKEMQKEVLRCIEKMLERDKKVLIVGDFNCKSSNWAEMEVTGNEGLWSERLLQMAMVNTLDQWVEECTRYRGEEEPAMLDLVSTKRPEPRPTIKYLGPMGKSDHILLEVEMQEEEVLRYKEDYKSGRLNYAKAKFDELRIFYGKIDWRKIMEGKKVQEKYDIFLEKYNEGVQKYVLLFNVRRKKYS